MSRPNFSFRPFVERRDSGEPYRPDKRWASSSERGCCRHIVNNGVRVNTYRLVHLYCVQGQCPDSSCEHVRLDQAEKSRGSLFVDAGDREVWLQADRQKGSDHGCGGGIVGHGNLETESHRRVPREIRDESLIVARCTTDGKLNNGAGAETGMVFIKKVLHMALRQGVQRLGRRHRSPRPPPCVLSCRDWRLWQALDLQQGIPKASGLQCRTQKKRGHERHACALPRAA